MSIIDKIRKIPDMDCVSGCSKEQVEEAQAELGMVFPKEYIDYVRAFGAVDFFGTEWTGLNINGYINTVQATKKEKGVNPAFPEKCFVLEDLGIDARKAIVNEKGQVFCLQYDNVELICNSISEYLDKCIARNN